MMPWREVNSKEEAILVECSPNFPKTEVKNKTKANLTRPLKEWRLILMRSKMHH
jgi:hypothetical protein